VESTQEKIRVIRVIGVVRVSPLYDGYVPERG
jgi:hypothetical protein